MTLNWLEEIVSQLYQIKGYLVLENEDLILPKTKYRKIRGHSDVDIMAIRENEIVHIECQSWWGPSPGDEEKREFRRLIDRFKYAPQTLFNKYTFLETEKYAIKKMFVTSGKPKFDKINGPWARLQKECNRNNIELKEINSIITEYILELRQKYPHKDKIGKLKGISRVMLQLIQNDFIKFR